MALYPPVRLGRLDEYFQQTATMIGSAQPVCIISDARVRRILGRLLPQVELPLGLLKAENLSNETAPIDLSPPQGNDLAMVSFSDHCCTQAGSPDPSTNSGQCRCHHGFFSPR